MTKDCNWLPLAFMVKPETFAPAFVPLISTRSAPPVLPLIVRDSVITGSGDVGVIEGTPEPTLKTIISKPEEPAVQASTTAFVFAASMASRKVQFPLFGASSNRELTVIVLKAAALGRLGKAS